MELANRLGSNWKDLASLFDFSPHLTERIQQRDIPATDMAMRFLLQARELGTQRYSELRQELRKISIFGTEVSCHGYVHKYFQYCNIMIVLIRVTMNGIPVYIWMGV